MVFAGLWDGWKDPANGKWLSSGPKWQVIGWQGCNLRGKPVLHVFSTLAEGSAAWTVTLCSGTQSSPNDRQT
jgi:hypothetical protein